MCVSAESITPHGDRPYGRLVDRQGLSDGHLMQIEAVRPGARVLDVGCASGYLAEQYAARGCRVFGIESDAANAERARRFCESVVVGDIENANDRAELPGPFDFVVFGDVLEHLRDPWTVLAATRTLLADDARVIVSIPNIAHWSARREILLGRFPYAESGLFDRTHLRFFTRASARALAQTTGYDVEREQFTRWRLPFQRKFKSLKRWEASLARRWPALFAFQFVMTLKPRAQA
jgi:2-polyprenyl-3-methyl-5-hydroxy-6-metoxy-1,4-benzoquinol methylase